MWSRSWFRIKCIFNNSIAQLITSLLLHSCNFFNEIFIEFHIISETEHKSGCNWYPDTKLTTPAYISCNNLIITFCFKERMATRMSTLKTKVRMKMVARTLSLVTCKGAVSTQQLLTFSLEFIFLEIWKKVTINSTFWNLEVPTLPDFDCETIGEIN